MESTFCVNCGSASGSMVLEDEQILHCIQQWTAPLLATSTDYICGACHILFSERDATEASQESTPNVGHQAVCIKCGRSLTNSRSYNVQAESIRHIIHIIQNWIQPRELQPMDLICHRCYQRAETSLSESRPTISRPQPADRILLPNYSRAPDTHSSCIFPACSSTSQRIIFNAFGKCMAVKG